MYKYTFKTRPHQLDNDVPLPKDKGMKKSIPQETLWASPFRTVTTLLGIESWTIHREAPNSSTGFLQPLES